MKITKDNFVWKILTLEEAIKIFELDIFEIFALHEDGSETLIHSLDYIINFAETGAELGIEVGKFEININVK